MIYTREERQRIAELSCGAMRALLGRQAVQGAHVMA